MFRTITITFQLERQVLNYLLPHTTPSAAVDSKARYPPPLCHPGTRQRIANTLETWLINSSRQWNMIWLSGPAGVGKSAVAQTFAEHCVGKGRLGAAFFFSRPNHRNHPDSVTPTLAYQLAVHSPSYKVLLNDQIANDPTIVEAAMRVQFRRLIVEPLSILLIQQPNEVREPYVMVLDGLDECNGDDAQCEIIEMIGEVIRLKKDLPLLWLICSRPEPHIRYAFSRTDPVILCGRETLLLDDEARAEVDQYLRDGFKDIRARFPYSASGSWPSEEEFNEVSHAASGLFIVASTALKYIGDSNLANPPARLTTFLSFVRNCYDAGSKSPLETLDILYSRILSDIPESVFPITKQILFHHIIIPTIGAGIPSSWSLSAKVLCNLLRLDQNTFYSALQKLHSVIDIPPPETAATSPLRFYHASFEDYVHNPTRSGKFVLEKQKGFVEVAKSLLSWHDIDSTLYHTDAIDNDYWSYRSHEHGALPGLRWVSDDDVDLISQDIAKCAERLCYAAFTHISDERDQDLLLQIRKLNFRYMLLSGRRGFTNFVDWVYQQTLGANTCNSIVRTEPHGGIDEKLLDYLDLLTNSELIVPMKFPLSRPYLGGYFLIGCDEKACVIHYTENYLFIVNGRPSEKEISRYRGWRRNSR